MTRDVAIEADDDLDAFLAGEPVEHPRISQDPRVMVGKPVIKGTRVPVYILVGLIGAGMTPDEVAREYPTITRDDVLAALRFASDYLERTAVSSFPAE